jgi:hypothetical protein
MQDMQLRLLLALFCALWLQASPAQERARKTGISSLKFLGNYVIPYNQSFDSTAIGGLSGIDYDEKENVFYLLSDDRGLHGKIRFYTARLDIGPTGVRSINFLKVNYLSGANKKLFDTQQRSHNPDAEAIRINPHDGTIYWASEGERVVSDKTKTLIDPFIYEADLTGTFLRSLSLPRNLRITDREHGPRQNGTLEGITFDRENKYLFATLEEPLYEDGPRADTVPNGAVCRIYKFDVASGKNVGQFAYPLEPVAFPPRPANKFKINGVSEILSTGMDNSLIAVERSFSMGRLPCTVRVFAADLSKADNVISEKSISGRKSGLIVKTLLLNMDELNIYIDNVEGVTFGPNLPNGNRTLVFVSDNNFNWFEESQLLVFEVIP